MDVTHSPAPPTASTIDSSRPFRSVKEAVAIFGERILLPEVPAPRKETPFYFPKSPVEDDHEKLSDAVKKLEAELEDTKAEIKLLKERESETEVALATLNAELHRNMSKLALAEAAMAKKASSVGVAADAVVREEEKKRDAYLRSNGGSPSVAEIISGAEKEDLFSRKTKRKKKGMKMKPIIPLVGELFNRKKGSTTAAALQNPLYGSPHLQWN